MTAKRTLALLGVMMLPSWLFAQPDHLTYVKLLNPGWYGEMQRDRVDSSYSLFLFGPGNASDFGILGEEILEDNEFATPIWHLNYNANLELESYFTENNATFSVVLPIFYRVGKRLNGDIVYATDYGMSYGNQMYTQNTNPTIQSNIGGLNPRSNMVVYNPIADEINAIYTSSTFNASYSDPYTYYRTNIQWHNTYRGFSYQKSIQINDSIAVFCEDYTGEQTINSDETFPNVEGHVGYIHSVINLNSYTVESFPVISEQGNYSLENIHVSQEGNGQYRIGVARGDQTKIAPDGTLFTSQPNDSLYHWLLTKESIYGEVEWTQRLNAMNNTFEDSTENLLLTMVTMNRPLDLVENENRIFISNTQIGEVSEMDDYIYTDFFDITTVYSDLAPGWAINGGVFSFLPTVFAKKSIFSLTTEGEKLATISKNEREHNYYRHKALYPVEDKLAWVDYYSAIADTTIHYTRTDNQGVVSSFNVELPAGIGTYIVWLNNDLEVLDHWLFNSTDRVDIGYIGMHNADTMLIQGCYWGHEQTANIIIDPSGIWEAITLPARNVFFALYNMGIVNDLGDKARPKAELKVYPNPASDQLQIALSQRNGITTYALFDVSGREVQAGQFSDASQVESISVAGLKPGIYLLKVQSGDITGVKKVVVE